MLVDAAFEASVSELHISETAERTWVLVHTDQAPLLLCAWYRPPCRGEIESIATMEVEWQKYKEYARGTILVGDVNVHSARWLGFSNGESPEGSTLRDVCERMGCRQLV